MKKQLLGTACILLATMSFGMPPAQAQYVVIDPAAIVQLAIQAAAQTNSLTTLKTTLGVSQTSLQQLQSLYQSFAHLTNASQVVPTLTQSAQVYPLRDLAAVEGILRTNGSGFTGNLATSALQVLQNSQYFKSTQSDFTAGEINTRAANTAGQLAASQLLYQSAQNRVAGLRDLNSQLAASSDPKQTADLAARAQIETALGQAQAQQSAALQMMQHAQQAETEERAEQNWREGAEALEAAETSAAGN